MERKLLPILLNENNTDCDDPFAKEFLVSVAKIHPRALFPHFHVLFQSLRTGPPQLAQLALSVVSSVDDHNVAKRIEEIISINNDEIMQNLSNIESMSPTSESMLRRMIKRTSKPSLIDTHTRTESTDSVTTPTKKIRLKTSFGDETHIVVITPETKWPALKRKIKQLSHEIRDFGIQYEDEEGDSITINSGMFYCLLY
jgi:hypothetical protein